MSDPKIERLLSNSELSTSQLRDVREAIYSSPYLVNLMKVAIDQQRLRHIGISDNPNESGSYDSVRGAIELNADVFEKKSQKIRFDEIVGVVGHETGHALMARSAELYTSEFAYSVEHAIREASRAGDLGVDISQFAKFYVDSSRKNEALAELVSMNSLASRVSVQQGRFDKEDFLRRADAGTSCIENGLLKSGINVNSDGYQLPGHGIDSPQIEKVAICHFDNGANTLGRKGTSEYPDYYAAGALGIAADIWRDYSRGTTLPMPRLALDVDLMKTSKQRMEDAGVDLGQPGRSFDFIAISGGQRRIESITQHGGEPSHRHPDALPDKPLLANNPAHQDFATFDRIHQWAKGTGHWNEEQSLNVSAALYRQQSEDPLVRRVDKVAGSLGRDGADNAFAIYAPFGDKGPFFHANVDGRLAAQQPAQQNLEQAEHTRQHQLQQDQREQTQQQNPQQTQSGHARSL